MSSEVKTAVTFFAEDAGEIDVVAVTERSAVSRYALTPVTTGVLVSTGVHGASSDSLKQ